MVAPVRARTTAARPIDRRVRRTRERLREAFFALLAEKGYERVTVADVLARADVGRSTFYAHFHSKDDLLASALDGLRGELRAAAARGDGRTLLPFTRAVIDHVASHRRIRDAMPTSGAMGLLVGRVRRVLIELATEELSARAAASGSRASPALLAEHVVGSLLALVTAWLSRRTELDAEGLEALFRRLVIPGLEAELRGRP